MCCANYPEAGVSGSGAAYDAALYSLKAARMKHWSFDTTCFASILLSISDLWPVTLKIVCPLVFIFCSLVLVLCYANYPEAGVLGSDAAYDATVGTVYSLKAARMKCSSFKITCCMFFCHFDLWPVRIICPLLLFLQSCATQTTQRPACQVRELRMIPPSTL